MLAGGASWGFAHNLVQVCVSLFVIPLTVAYLGTERFGLWTLSLNIMSFATLLDAGLTPALQNRLTEAFTSGDASRRRYYLSGAAGLAVLTLFAGTLMSGALLLLDWKSLLNLRGTASWEAGHLVAAVVLIASVCAATAFLDAAYISRLEVARVKLYSTVASVTSVGLTLGAVRAEAGLPVLALAILSPRLLYRPVLLVLLLARGELELPRVSHVPRLVRELIPSSAAFAGIQILEVTTSAIPVFLLSRYSSLGAVAQYGLALKACTLPLGLLAAVMPAFWPVFTVAWSRRELEWLRRRLSLMVMLTICAGAPFIAFLWIAGAPLLEFWVGGRIQVETRLLTALGLWAVIQGSIYWLNTFLHSISDLRFEVIWNALAAAATFAIGSAVATRYGPFGVVLGMTSAILLGLLIPYTIRVRHWLCPGSPDRAGNLPAPIAHESAQ